MCDVKRDWDYHLIPRLRSNSRASADEVKAVRLGIGIVIFLWVSGNSLAFGQDTVRSGFAVVTLISGNVAGLIATESLMNRTSTGIQGTIVPPSPLVPTASMLVPVGPIVENTTAIAIANPSAGSGGVNFILTDSVGAIVLNTSIRLGPFGHFSKYLNEFFRIPPGPFSTPLLLTVSSEIPVAMLALNFRSEDFASIPLTSLSFPTAVPVQPLTPPNSAPQPGPPPTPIVSPPVIANNSTPQTAVSIGGSGSMAFAEVAAGGGWSTEIAIGNTSSAPQIIRVDFFGPNGVNTDSVTNVVIPPRGVFLFSTESAGGL
jgi:hypothetical protein